MTISKNIMQIDEFDKAIIFRASCACSNSDCDMTLDMEIDEKFQSINLNIHKKLGWSSYWGTNNNYFSEKWKRICCALKMLFTGYVEVEEAFLMKEETIDDFIEALITSKYKLKKIIDNEQDQVQTL